MNPADLNDPEKVKTFLHKCVADYDEQIERMEAAAQRRLEKYRRELHDTPAILLEFEEAVQESLHFETKPLKESRDALTKRLNIAKALDHLLETIQS